MNNLLLIGISLGIIFVLIIVIFEIRPFLVKIKEIERKNLNKIEETIEYIFALPLLLPAVIDISITLFLASNLRLGGAVGGIIAMSISITISAIIASRKLWLK
jgi:hypothetical protein